MLAELIQHVKATSFELTDFEIETQVSKQANSHKHASKQSRRVAWSDAELIQLL